MATPLTLPATKRIVFMLGWDIEVSANVSRKPSFWENLKGRVVVPLLGDNQSLAVDPDDSVDLDLACYIFDANKKLIDRITPGVGHDVNDNESVYHSGDDEAGRSGEFDEELSVDLARLPLETNAILLYIRVNGDIDVSPDTKVKYRIMNATDGRVVLNQALPFDQKNEKGYVLGRLSRDGDHWLYAPISQYVFSHPDGQEETLFNEYL